jgi:hypothetical protein
VLLFLIIIYLFLKTFEMADPPPVAFVMKTETVIDQLVLENLRVESGGMGGGTPSDDPVADPTPQTQQVITKAKNPKTKTNTGKSSHTTTPNSQNSASTPQQSNNPFGGGNDGKEGGGSGGPFGADKGNTGPGPGGQGSGANRSRLNDPSVDHISTDVTVTIYLKLTINEDGNVVSAVNTSKTTTTDQRIINQVITAVKSQVKYNKDAGAGLATTYWTINVSAT